MPSITRRELVAGVHEGEPKECLRPYQDPSAKFPVPMRLVVWNKRGEVEGLLAERGEHSSGCRMRTELSLVQEQA